ncbi:MAG: pyridoxal-phosphate dependent enzyme [Chloroflexi bacterium]|nr:pyridoxal-phosphate dependent enzyme [Chloroflexota bacterium]
MTQHLTPNELQTHIDKLPRMKMAHLPTPLEEMPRLTERLGGPNIWIKREDMTGLAYGGNKARHYEFEMPHVSEQGYDVMINVMDYHSNNARMTAAAANKIGMRYILVLKNAANRIVQGNLLIDKILGAELHLLDEYQSGDADGYATRLKEQLEAEGHKPYLIQEHVFPRIVGMVGFVQAGIEILEQINENDLKNIHFIGVAGRSLCGLIIAAKAMGLDWKFTGVTVNYDVPLGDYIFKHNKDIQELLDLPVTFEQSDMRVLDQYVGEGYGVMTAEVNEAIHIAAQTDAIICDPNYTGTAMAALIDQIKEGGFDDDETIIFLHTGGLPAVFTFAEQLANFKGTV